MSRIYSNLPIIGYVVANQDPPKNQLSTLKVRHGVLGFLAVSHAGGRGFYSKSSSLNVTTIFFLSEVALTYLLIFNNYL